MHSKMATAMSMSFISSTGHLVIKIVITCSKTYFECERKNITLEILNHSMYKHSIVSYTYTYMYTAERVP